MKSLNPSFVTLNRAAIAAAVLLTAGSVAALAQSSTSQGSSMNDTSNNNNSNYNNSSSSSSSNMGQNGSDMSSTSNSDMSSNMNSSSNDQSNNDKLSWGDRRFVHKAAKDGKAEVALGQLAAEKASNPDVRSFAQQLIQDHEAADAQLMQLASQKNVKMDSKEDGKDHTYNRLSKKSGQDFDREFVDHAVKMHQDDVKDFEKEAKDAKDPDVRNFAAQVLPKLREHLAMAQRLQQSIVPTGRSDNSSGRSDWNSSTSSSTGANGSMTSSTGTSESSDLSGSSATGGSTGATSSTSGATSNGTSSSTSSTQ